MRLQAIISLCIFYLSFLKTYAENFNQISLKVESGMIERDLNCKLSEEIVTKAKQYKLTRKASVFSKTVNNIAGNLSSVLTTDDLNTVTDLIITGTMDARDFKTIRDNMTALSGIDLSGVTVVAYEGTNGTDTVGLNKVYEANSIPQFALYNSEMKMVNSLTSIVLPANLIAINKYAFIEQDINLINIPATVKKIDLGAFQSCKKISSLNIETNGETIISTSAFRNCTALTSINVGKGVESIGDRAFQDCSSLTTVSISSDLKTIGKWMFWNCLKLSSINMCQDNPGFCSVSGVLFNKEKTVLFHYPQGFQTSYVVPDNVITIGVGAFGSANKLTNITFPNSMNSIEDWAFEMCSSLVTVNYGNGLAKIGAGAFFKCANLTTGSLPNSIISVGNDAFNSCFSMSNLSIPINVKNVGLWAFSSCNKLNSVTYNAKNCIQMGSMTYPVFNNCVLLNTLNIEEDVDSIPDNAFYNCSKLTSISIGKNVQKIGQYAFYNCSSINSIIIPRNVKTIGVSAFNYCNMLSEVSFDAENCSDFNITDWPFLQCNALNRVNFGNEVRSIPGRIFQTCPSIKEITIGEKVQRIGVGAFYGCKGLTSITIPRSVKIINHDAFGLCENLAVVNFNAENCTYMGIESYYVFSGCDNFTTLNIGADVISIPDYAFSECSVLKNISFGNKILSIGKEAFYSCSVLKTIAIPQSVSSIGDAAFSNCTSLETVVLGKNISTIGNEPFFNCNLLKSIDVNTENLVYCSDNGVLFDKIKSRLIKCPALAITGKYNIPPTVVTIDETAFFNCSNMTSITIGNKVNLIKYGAFAKCTGLAEIVCQNDTPPDLGEYVFTNVPTATCKLYVPTLSVNKYISSYQWRDFVNILPLDYSSISMTKECPVTVFSRIGFLIINGCNENDIVDVTNLSGKRIYSGLIGNGLIYTGLNTGTICIIKTPYKSVKMII